MPSRPALETWLQIAIGPASCARSASPSPPARAWSATAARAALDVDEYLAEDKPEPEPVIPTVAEDEPRRRADRGDAAADTSIPSRSRRARRLAVARAAAPSLAPKASRRRAAAIAPCRPRGSRPASPTKSSPRPPRGSPLVARGQPRRRRRTSPSDFGLDAEQWVESADEVVYRIAVAAALAFRLDRDRAAVIAAYTALDKAGVLADLYQGTVPENLPAQVDARALMLASLAARRCAEVPELASQLDGRGSAAEAFAALDAALGRGLFRTELFWIMDMLAQLGVIRYDDLGDFTVTPHRIVRDTLFRLGFIATPYASDAAALAAAAKAARRAVPEGPADEILTMFALAAGCAYDCTHRKTCDFPCRERSSNSAAPAHLITYATGARVGRKALS